MRIWHERREEPPHPRPLSREGRGEKTCMRGIAVGSGTTGHSSSPLAPCGSGVGGEGSSSDGPNIVCGHSAARL